jgi:hypothetical protein
MTQFVDDIMKPYLYKAAQTLNTLNFYDTLNEYDDDPNNVASSEATFVFSGPPVAKATYTVGSSTPTVGPPSPGTGLKIQDLLKPIGAVQQINVQAGKQIIPFRELGSKLLRQAAGSTQYSGAISRVLTRQNNLKYALYRWLFEGILKGDSLALSRLPGDNNQQFIGLESELYNIPFGLLILVGSAGGRVIQAEYLEKCHIVSDGSSKQVGNNMIIDNISFTVSRSIPFVQATGAVEIGKGNFLKQNIDGNIGRFAFGGAFSDAAGNELGLVPPAQANVIQST